MSKENKPMQSSQNTHVHLWKHTTIHPTTTVVSQTLKGLFRVTVGVNIGKNKSIKTG